jgi:hypothetical protein
MAVQATKGVRTQHPDFIRMSPIWKRCRDVIAGQVAMHMAGAAYLPKLKEESDEDHRGRIGRSDFFNGTWITIRAFVGMLFRKPPTKDIPPGMTEYLQDVTATGKEVETFAKALAHEALTVTRYGILVDHPPQQTDGDGKVVPITKAVAEKLGLRPKLALYKAESITNWKPQESGKPGQYAMVTLCEEHPIPDDRFSHKIEKRWRVLDLDEAGFYRQQVWRVDAKGNDEQVGGDIYPLMDGKPLGYVPFKTYGADGEEAEVDEPALIDLVEANVAVYQINSDYRHGLHWTGLPTLFLAGLDSDPDKKYYIGSAAAITASHPDAKASFIEFTGQGLSELREAIREKKQEMAMAGARAIMDETKQVETLGGTQIKRNGENSALANVAITVSASLEWALGVFAQWAGQDSKIVYQLNRIFMPVMMDAQTLAGLIAANQAGKLSDEELFGLMQQGDVIDSEVSFEEHQAKVETQNPSPARPTKKPGEEIAA